MRFMLITISNKYRYGSVVLPAANYHNVHSNWLCWCCLFRSSLHGSPRANIMYSLWRNWVGNQFVIITKHKALHTEKYDVLLSMKLTLNYGYRHWLDFPIAWRTIYVRMVKSCHDWFKWWLIGYLASNNNLSGILSEMISLSKFVDEIVDIDS